MTDSDTDDSDIKLLRAYTETDEPLRFAFDVAEYQLTFGDGERVHVSLDGFENGDDLRVRHYDAADARLGYYRFTVNDADARVVTYRHGGDDTRPPDQVVRAVHRGGWVIKNVEGAVPYYDAGCPVEVRLLDIRDYLHSAADRPDDSQSSAALRSVARAAEEAANILFITGQTSLRGDDPDEVASGILTKMGKGREPGEIIEGAIVSAVTDSKSSTEHHDRNIGLIEDLRWLYRSGAAESYGEAMEMLVEETDAG